MNGKSSSLQHVCVDRPGLGLNAPGGELGHHEDGLGSRLRNDQHSVRKRRYIPDQSLRRVKAALDRFKNDPNLLPPRNQRVTAPAKWLF